MMNNLQESNPLKNERIFFNENIWNRFPDDCFREATFITYLLFLYSRLYIPLIFIFMITTSHSYRNELQATERVTIKLPPHALPK